MRVAKSFFEGVCYAVDGQYGIDFEGPFCMYRGEKIRLGRGRKYKYTISFLMRYSDLLKEKNLPFNPWPDPLHTGWLTDACADVIRLGRPDLLPTEDDLKEWIRRREVVPVTYVRFR